MRKVTFSIGFDEETFEFPNQTTDKEIDEQFEQWFDKSVCCGWENSKE